MRGFTGFIFGLAAITNAAASPTPEKGSVPLPQRLLHQFPLGTWVENISVRPNGNLLVSTSTPNASVYQVSKPWTKDPEVTLVHTFSEYVDRLIGIGESSPDKYVVVGSRFTSAELTGVPINGTWATMELDFTRNTNRPVFRLIAAMPEANLLQSVAALPHDPATVLISDQFLRSPGQVWRLDTRTGKYGLAIKDLPELNTTNKVADVGINGIKIRGNKFYWANSDSNIIYRLKIDRTGAPAHGAKPEVVSHFPGAVYDDFVFGPGNEDEIWATGNADNRLLAIRSDGKTVIVLGNGTDSVFASPTAAGFGKHHFDKNILYVSGRDKELPSNGTFHIGGWVRAVDTTGFRF
ncbi:hypothetical protein O9K51_03936 [Purpureocillium lavendulum]|uniref:SMP-30/Gluconolactonase/LRE-like region domain-containing protein n=1 Tax=Purpureocillium lavendulum TaxID=1247861 RepID=A0AB34FVV4_9HYPO|nr:hypothetical protein O9K51_03936 [Purpureocillium lavendulum]